LAAAGRSPAGKQRTKGGVIGLAGGPEAVLLLERNQRFLRALPEFAIGIADIEALLVQRRLRLAYPVLTGDIDMRRAAAMPVRMQGAAAGLAAGANVPLGGTSHALIGQAVLRIGQVALRRPVVRRKILVAVFSRERRCRLAACRPHPVLLRPQTPLPHGVIQG
jgi:hypothetical protein